MAIAQSRAATGVKLEKIGQGMPIGPARRVPTSAKNTCSANQTVRFRITPTTAAVVADRAAARRGRAAIQYISMADDLFEDYAGAADFIQAYIFPGGLLINTSEFRALAEARGLMWREQTDFGLDYAETLRLWRARFDLAVEENRLPDGFDARFVRLWRYYLAYCEAGFRCGNVNVHQVPLVNA